MDLRSTRTGTSTQSSPSTATTTSGSGTRIRISGTILIYRKDSGTGRKEKMLKEHRSA